MLAHDDYLLHRVGQERKTSNHYLLEMFFLVNVAGAQKQQI